MADNRDPLRSLRVSDELWFAALEKAREQGRPLSEVIRELMTRWVKRK